MSYTPTHNTPYMMNHVSPNHHDDRIKQPTNTTSTTISIASWEHLNMVVEENHHPHNHHQAQEQHQDHVQHHFHQLIPLLDPVWNNYHALPTPDHQSPHNLPLPIPSMTALMMKPSGEINENINDHHHHEEGEIRDVDDEDDDDDQEELGAMKEMMYRIAVMQPVDIDPATIRRPKRRNVRISDDPQSVAARHRRERISEKVRILQRLVPGGTKMDTASMLDEAIRYVKYLRRQIRQLQSTNRPPPPIPMPPSDWPALVGPTSTENSNRPLEGKVVVIREPHNNNSQGMIYQQLHGGRTMHVARRRS